MIQQKAIGAATFSPTEMTTAAIDRIEHLAAHSHTAVPISIAALRQGGYFAPVQSGQLTAIIAQTSNGKSLLLDGWADMLARGIYAVNGDDTIDIVVKVDVETVVEDDGMKKIAQYSGIPMANLATGNVSDDQWVSIHKAALEANRLPLYRVAGSVMNAGRIAPLSLDVVKQEIEHLRSKTFGRKLNITAIFVDYLQALPVSGHNRRAGSDQRRLQVRDDIYGLREMSVMFDAPVIVGVQAKQHLNQVNNGLYIPSAYDGEESSSIAQRADRIVTLWLPKQTYPVGHELKIGDMVVRVEETMAFVRVAKQRGGLRAGKTWICKIDHKTNEFILDERYSS